MARLPITPSNGARITVKDRSRSAFGQRRLELLERAERFDLLSLQHVDIGSGRFERRLARLHGGITLIAVGLRLSSVPRPDSSTMRARATIFCAVLPSATSRFSVVRSLGLTYRHASMFRMPPLLICREWGQAFPDQALTLAAHRSPRPSRHHLRDERRELSTPRRTRPQAWSRPPAHPCDNQGKGLIDAQRQSNSGTKKTLAKL